MLYVSDININRSFIKIVFIYTYVYLKYSSVNMIKYAIHTLCILLGKILMIRVKQKVYKF